MAAATGLTGLTIGAGIVGTVLQIKGQATAAAASKKAEDARKRQMNLEADRMRRQAIREAIVARATALSNATTQGAQDSSGLAGGIAQVTGQEGRNILGINQNQEIGNIIFDQNAKMAQGNSLANLGSSVQGFGSMIGQYTPQLTRIGNYYNNRPY